MQHFETKHLGALIDYTESKNIVGIIHPLVSTRVCVCVCPCVHACVCVYACLFVVSGTPHTRRCLSCESKGVCVRHVCVRVCLCVQLKVGRQPE